MYFLKQTCLKFDVLTVLFQIRKPVKQRLRNFLKITNIKTITFTLKIYETVVFAFIIK